MTPRRYNSKLHQHDAKSLKMSLKMSFKIHMNQHISKKMARHDIHFPTSIQQENGRAKRHT